MGRITDLKRKGVHDTAEADLRRTGDRLRLVARARNVMAECNRVLVRATGELQLLQDMCRIVVERGGYRMAWVGLVRHDEGSTIEPVASAGDDDGYLASIRLSWADAEFGQGPSGRAVRSGEPQIVRDIGTDPKFVQWREAALARGDCKVATFPLKGKGETIGVVSIHAGEAQAFDPDEVELLEELANDMAYGIFNLRTREAHRHAEAEIEQSEQRFHTTFDLVPVGINHIDLEGRILLANPRMGQILGYTPGELIGRNIKEFSFAEDEEATRELWTLREKLYAGIIQNISAERRYRHKDGSPVLVALTITAQRNGDGRLLYDITALEDITSRKREERLLALEHSVTRCLAEAASAPAALESVIRAICESEGWDSGRYFSWDDEAKVLRFRDAWSIPAPRMREFIERSRDLVFPPGQGLVGRVWQSNQPLWVADINSDPRALRAGFAIDLGIRGAFVFPVASEGSTIGVLVFSSSDIRQPDERLLGAVHAIGSQVGQFLRRSQAEDVVRESEERFRSLTGLSSDWYWEQDENFRFTQISNATKDPTGRSPLSNIGKTRWDLPALNMTEANWAAHRAALEAHQPFYDLELVRRTAEGLPKYTSMSGEPMFDRFGTFKGYRGIGKDITARKRAEQLQALEHAVNRSLADAHSPSAAVQAVIRAVCETESWGCGRYFHWDERDGVLRFSESWNVPDLVIERFIEKFRDITYAPGVGLVGRVWETGQPLWVPDITRDPRVSKAVLARDTGMHGAFVFPVISEGKTIGVLAFDSREVREPEERLLQAIGVIGSQIGQFLQRKQSEEELHESNERFDTAVRATSDVIWDWNLLTDALWWNENFSKVFGYPSEKVDPTVKSWYDGIHPEDRERVVAGTRRLIESGGQDWSDEYRFRREDGSYAHVFDRGHVIRSDEGKAVRMIGAMADITFRKQAEEKVRNQALQQRSIAEFGQQVLASTDLADVLKRAVELVSKTLNAEYCDVLELDQDRRRLMYKATVGWPSEWVGRRTVNLVPGGNLEYTLSSRETVVIEDLQKDMRFAPSPLVGLGIRSTVRSPILGTKGAFGVLGVHSIQLRRFTEEEVSFLRNVANILAVAIERRLAEERLAYLAQFDALTGLPNRHLFHDRLLQTMAQGRRSGNPMAVLYVDLDRFKLVNDTQGHGAGDKLLQEAATRLTQCIRSGDTVGRFGGDEFGAVLSDLAKPGDASIVAQKIIDALARPFDLDGHETYVSASVGITLFPADSEDSGALIMNADTAMYRAKEQGRSTYQYFTREMNERVLARMQVEAALRRALERKEFLLHYQPKVDLESGVICGFEALLRWQHPERGMVSPVEFIPVLEDAGLIVPVGEWVMREVCRQIQAWKSSGLAVPPVAVNLSARQFLQKELEATVRLILRESGVDPSLIQFELTESLLMKEPEAAARTLRGLKESGVKILVDDFGTGYSSLAYLKRFPIDALKIDRAFVRDVTTNPEDAAITLAIIGLAHSLKLKVVAEGVETEGQLNFLSTHGCDEMQGYYFSRAVPPSECEAMLREGRRLSLSASGTAAKPAVLLLDDDERDLMLLEQILRVDGFPVLKTTDPKRAFELLASHPVGIVISDQSMPGLTGVEFLSHVRKLYPDVIRIVATGSHDPKAFADAVNEAGVHKFLMKDWDGDRLRAEIRDVSRRYRARAAAKILPRGRPEKALAQTLDT